MAGRHAAGAVLTGPPSGLASHQARLADAGVHRTIIQIAAGDWTRQAALAAEARSQLT